MIGFGYSSPIKDYIDTCAYTGKQLKRNQRTLEHIKPHSKSGQNIMSNYLVAGQKINEARGNMPFTKWLRIFPQAIKNIQNYLDKYRGLKINGVDYVEVVKKTLNKEAKGIVSFRGNS